MSMRKKFISDSRGEIVERVALFAAGVAVCSVIGAWALDRATRSTAFPRLALFQSDDSGANYSRVVAGLPRPVQNGTSTVQQTTVDFTPVGAVPANLLSRIVLDPCTGKQK